MSFRKSTYKYNCYYIPHKERNLDVTLQTHRFNYKLLVYALSSSFILYFFTILIKQSVVYDNQIKSDFESMKINQVSHDYLFYSLNKRIYNSDIEEISII